jgi:integrase/recombinase XerD
VTHLRKLMLEELQLRNYAQNTIRHYLRAVEDFARHFNCSPDRLGPRHIREYQAALFKKRKLSANSVGQHLAALRFFYIKTLRRTWSLAETPYPKKTRRLPTILSREEVAQLLHAARTPVERIVLMTLYASGARNSELTHLQVSDIDSQRMVVHIRGGKGRKDRLWAMAHKRSYVPGKVMCSGRRRNLRRQASRSDCPAHNYLPLNEAMSLSAGRK